MNFNIEYEIKPVKGLSLNLREVWQYRELFYFFTWRDIKVKYKQTILGFLWAVLQPFILMVVFTVFFSKFLKVPSDGIPYPIFVYSGLMLWGIFANGLNGAANSMVSNAHIIKKIYFPRIIIPMSSVLGALFDFIMALVVYIAMMIYYQWPVDWTIALALPLSLLTVVIFTFGLGCFLAAMNVKYRDFRYIVPFIIQLLFFLTPVIYPVSIINIPWIQKLLAFNPMTGAINIFRSAVLQKPIEIEDLLFGLGTALVVFILGLLYFRRTEHYFADVA